MNSRNTFTNSKGYFVLKNHLKTLNFKIFVIQTLRFSILTFNKYS